MIKHLTAYPITYANLDLLHHITGIEIKTLKVSIGWCVAYSEARHDRWLIAPEYVAVNELLCDIDRVSYP